MLHLLSTAAADLNPVGTVGTAARQWSAEEDALLVEAVEKHATNWKHAAIWPVIAAHVGTRNRTQCQQRWTAVLRPGINKGSWSAEEDASLVRLVDEFGCDWPKITDHWLSTLPPGASCRSIKQIRERWTNRLDPTLSKSPWTAEEDHQIISLQKNLGNKWANIAAQMPGRVGEGVKVRFKTLHRREQKALRQSRENVLRTHPHVKTASKKRKVSVPVSEARNEDTSATVRSA
jgi:hypothetical protein